jgi:hypothetical protein
LNLRKLISIFIIIFSNESSSIQEFARGVINELIIPEKEKRLTKAERLKLEAEAFNISWAFGELKKQQKPK